MSELPTGTVTFVFTDIEGSTRLLQRVGEAYANLLATHHRILRDAITAGGGIEVETEGDAFFATFPAPAGAIRTAVQAQGALSSHSWPVGNVVRVRMGVHTGEGVLSDGGYIGLDVHRAARIAAAGHGGQVLVSEATRALVEHALPVGVDLRDLGLHRLKDIEQPEHLYELLIDGLPDAFPPLRTLDARLSNLPVERSSFIGREREVGEVTGLLEGARLLTLTGPGGIGKTRLALKVAADQLGRFADGVYLADLTHITDPNLVPAAIASSLRMREQPGRDVLDSLADHLRDRELLLVLDNMEQVIEAASAVGHLIDAAPQLTVLATSRVPLHITGEQEFPVPPLALPDPVRGSDLESLTSNEAVTLFIQRAAAVRPGMRLTAADAPTIAQIAVKLDGLPLAIELAASRAKLLAPDAILARLGARLSLLTTGASDLPARQRTLRSTMEWSHDLLKADEQRLFARLGTFSGGWTLEAAEVICGPGLDVGVLDGLGTLVDHSMVRPGQAGNGEPRFTMLETIREFAVERLAVSGEVDELQRRHAEHFRKLAEEAALRLTREDRVGWLARLEAEIDNLRAALDWAERTGDADTGLRTAAAIWRFWQERAHLSEGRGRLERLLAMPGSAARAPLRARALAALGGIAYWQNDYPVTRAAYDEAVDIARVVRDPTLLASALLDLSFIPLMMEDDADRAEAILREGLAIAQDAGDRLLTAQFWGSLASLEVVRGNPGDAIPLGRTAIEIFREEGEVLDVASLVVGLALISRIAGDLDSARGHLREALGTFAQARETMGISGVLTGFAAVANDDGLPERAARLIGASARIRDELGGGIPPELIGSLVGDPASDAKVALGDAAYGRARAEGYAMDTETAVAYARDDGANDKTQKGASWASA
jgi:predicted ATPase/class 3 adenylate cyclase